MQPTMESTMSTSLQVPQVIQPTMLQVLQVIQPTIESTGRVGPLHPVMASNGREVLMKPVSVADRRLPEREQPDTTEGKGWLGERLRGDWSDATQDVAELAKA